MEIEPLRPKLIPSRSIKNVGDEIGIDLRLLSMSCRVDKESTNLISGTKIGRA